MAKRSASLAKAKFIGLRQCEIGGIGQRAYKSSKVTCMLAAGKCQILGSLLPSRKLMRHPANLESRQQKRNHRIAAPARAVLSRRVATLRWHASISTRSLRQPEMAE